MDKEHSATMLIILLSAFILGLVVSVPIGSIGQLMISRSIKYGFWAGLSIGLFSALMDATYCEFGLVGISLMSNSVEIRAIVQGVGLIVLLYFGYRNFRPVKELPGNDEEYDGKICFNVKQNWATYVKYFPVVLIGSASNPTTFAFWLSMANLLRSTILAHEGVREFTVFSAGVGTGSAVCQYIILRLLHRSKLFHSAAKKIVIRRTAAFIFIFSMGYLVYDLIKELISHKM